VNISEQFTQKNIKLMITLTAKCIPADTFTHFLDVNGFAQAELVSI